jgi:hypothetical protein
MTLRNRATAALVLSSTLLSACGGITPADAPALRVEVLNNVSPAKSLTIYAELPGGSKPLLGEVSAGATRTLDLNLSEGEYRLVAGAADGTRIYSRSLQGSQGARLRWDVQNNVVADAR